MELTPLPEEIFEQLSDVLNQSEKLKDPEQRELTQKAVGNVLDKLQEKGFTVPEKQQRGFLENLGRGALDVLGYVPGNIATAAMSVLPRYSKAIGKEELLSAVNPFDLRPAPTFTEMEQKLYGKFSPLKEASLADVPFFREIGIKPGSALDITKRGALTFAADVASDPTILLGGARFAAKKLLGKSLPETSSKAALLASPISTTLEKSAKALYKKGTGLGEVDTLTRQAGKRLVSGVMYRHGFRGGAQNALSAHTELQALLGKELDDLVDASSEVISSMKNPEKFTAHPAALYGEAIQELGEHRSTAVKSGNKAYESATDEAFNQIMKTFDEGLKSSASGAPYLPPKRLSLRDLLDTKRQYQDLAASHRAYDISGQVPTGTRGVQAGESIASSRLVGQAYARIAKAADERIGKILQDLNPRLRNKYDDVNADLSSLFITKEKMAEVAAKQAAQSRGRAAIGAVAGGAAAGGLASIPQILSGLGSWTTSVPGYAATMGAAALGIPTGIVLTHPEITSRLGYWGAKAAPLAGSAARTEIESQWGPQARKRTPWEEFKIKLGR